jgi:CHASE3 domain sensor protein
MKPLGSVAHVAFGAAAVVILGLGWVLYNASMQSRESAGLVSHSPEVWQAINEVDEQVNRAESAERGYLMTADEAFCRSGIKRLQRQTQTPL